VMNGGLIGRVGGTPYCAGIIVNSGQLLAQITNDRWTATRHYALNGLERERYSIPFFFNASVRLCVFVCMCVFECMCVVRVFWLRIPALSVSIGPVCLSVGCLAVYCVCIYCLRVCVSACVHLR